MVLVVEVVVVVVVVVVSWVKQRLFLEGEERMRLCIIGLWMCWNGKAWQPTETEDTKTDTNKDIDNDNDKDNDKDGRNVNLLEDRRNKKFVL